MAYDLRQWPASVYPGEVKEFPEAATDIDVALRALQTHGPMLDEFEYKPLGAKKGGLWQINLRITASKRQIRILYAPYHGVAIVVFHIHKKSSPQEQERAYKRAKDRKRKAEEIMRSAGNSHVTLPTTFH